MAGEQMLILQMLEAGKITADQAVGLLEALSQGSADTASPSNVVAQSEQQSVSRAVREEERRARQAVREEAAQARETARKARAEARRTANGAHRSRPEKTIMSSLRALGIPLGGSKEFSFTRSLSGKFVAANPSIRLQNTNGHIEISPSADEQWQLQLVTRVRADNQASAQALADRLVHVESDEQFLTVEAQRMFGQNASVAIELQLPVRDYNDLNVTTTNGTIQLAELAATSMAVKTVNGKVIGERLTTNDLQASSVNGTVAIDGAIGRIQAHAVNGRLTVEITEAMHAELDLKSVNGAIRVELPEAATIGYQLNATSTAGNIRHDLPGLVVSEEQKRPGRRTLVAASNDLAAKELRQTVKASTVSGDIRINV